MASRAGPPFVQGVEQDLAHDLGPQHPGVERLVHHVDEALHRAEHGLGEGHGDDAATRFRRGGGRVPHLQQQGLQRRHVDLHREPHQGGFGGGEALALAGQRQGHHQVVLGVVAEGEVREIAHLVPLQDDDHARAVEHRDAVVMLRGVDEVHAGHGGGGDPRVGCQGGESAGEGGLVGHRDGLICTHLSRLSRNRQEIGRKLP